MILTGKNFKLRHSVKINKNVEKVFTIEYLTYFAIG